MTTPAFFRSNEKVSQTIITAVTSVTKFSSVHVLNVWSLEMPVFSLYSIFKTQNVYAHVLQNDPGIDETQCFGTPHSHDLMQVGIWGLMSAHTVGSYESE